MPSGHPTEQVLRAYRLGTLDAVSVAPVAEHIRICAVCKNRLDTLVFEHSVKRATVRPVQTFVEGAGAHAEPASAAIAPAVPDLPDYEMIRRLGEGGMGVVYLARNTLMGRLEVLKVLARHLVAQPHAMDRFLREIQSAARLQHRNIISAYSAIRWDGGLILAMEYVEGEDLANRVEARGPLSVAEACNYAYQAARGLHQAHRVGMVHRDIKPANLILDLAREKGLVKILDFGLAKVTSENPIDGGMTRQGLMLGTPDYISPEQIRNAQKADIRADIYSLGCTLYFLLTGGPPFNGASLYDILQAHHSNEASPLNLVRSDIPVELAALVAKMMAKEPENRFQTPDLVAAALLPYFRADAAAKSVPKTGTGAPPVANRNATVVETDSSPPSARPVRQATIVDGSPGIASNPPRSPRQATIVEGNATIVPTPARQPRQATMLESAAEPVTQVPELEYPLQVPEPQSPLANLTLSDDVPRASKPRSSSIDDQGIPLWRQPYVLVPSGVVAVALVALGLIVANRQPASEPASPAATEPSAQARATTPVFDSQETAPDGFGTTPPPVQVASADSRIKLDPLSTAPQIKPGPMNVVEPTGAEPEPESPEAEEPDELEPAPVAELVNPPAKPIDKPKPGPDGLVYAEYKQVAASPSLYEGLKVVPDEYLIASAVNPPGNMAPGFGTLKVVNQINQTLSGLRGTSSYQGGQLGIVLAPELAASLKGYMAANKKQKKTKRAWKIIPTFEIRRSELPTTSPWLAVITSVKVVAQNDQRLLKGDRVNVFSLLVFDAKGRSEQPVGEDLYDYFDGSAERAKLLKLEFAKIATAKRQDAEAQLNSVIQAGIRDSQARSAMDEAARAAQMRRLFQGR